MKRSIAALAAAGMTGGAASPVLAHGGGGAPPTDLVGIALAWHFDLPIVIGLLAGGYAYLTAARSVSARHPTNPWPEWRSALLVAGLLAVCVALVSPIDTLSDDLLSVHMVQHMLLTTVAPPLFAASGIGTLALRVASRDVRNRLLLPLLHSRIVTALTFPVVGWVAFTGAMWGSHFTGLYNLAVLDDGVHALEHLLYLATASLFWWPLVSPDPLRWRLHPGAKLLAVLAQLPAMSVLAVTIIGARSVLYPAYLGRADAFGINALVDQQIAGGLMWLLADLSFVALAGIVVVRWFRYEDEEARRVDARLDRASRQPFPARRPDRP